MGEQSESFISMRYGLVLIFLVAASLAGCERRASTSAQPSRTPFVSRSLNPGGRIVAIRVAESPPVDLEIEPDPLGPGTRKSCRQSNRFIVFQDSAR